MILCSYVPRAPLSQCVDKLWLFAGTTERQGKERVLPSGTMQLLVDLRDETGAHPPVSGALLAGPRSESFTLDASRRTCMMGVHFRPGGAYPFFHAPAFELHNAHVALELLWGTRAGELRERLLEARQPANRFRILESFLLAQQVRPLAPRPAVAYALRAFQAESPVRRVSEVIEHVDSSAKRFIRIFRDEVGMTPKLYWRVRRFQDVLGRVARDADLEWADVALACGYYDQAHFIHDFHAFSGLSPTAYREAHCLHPNHVPLAD